MCTRNSFEPKPPADYPENKVSSAEGPRVSGAARARKGIWSCAARRKPSAPIHLLPNPDSGAALEFDSAFPAALHPIDGAGTLAVQAERAVVLFGNGHPLVGLPVGAG